MKTTETELARVVAESPFTVVHIDAVWDGYRGIVAGKIMELTERRIPDVAFAYIDCDEERNYAEAIRLRNVPAVAYYRSSMLVATVIGVGQDIAENLKILVSGGIPDASNTISRK